MKPKTRPSLIAHPNLEYWVLFCVFLLSNTLLSYSSLSLVGKLWVGLLGVLLPLAFALFLSDSRRIPSFQASNKATSSKFFQNETLDLSSDWPWILVVFLFLLGALVRVFFVNHWPVPDEGALASEAAELSQKWRWNYFFTPAQHPPFFFWSLAFLFRLIPPSLFAIKFFPLLWAGAAFALSYRTARFFFSRSVSFLFFVLCGFSFWPLYSARICGYMTPLFFWEIFCFAFLGWFLQKHSRFPVRTRALFLGIVTALGLGWAIAWPLVMLFITVAVFWKNRRDSPRYSSWWFYFSPLLVAVAVFIALSVHENNGRHILFLLSFHSSQGLFRQLLDSFSNFKALFWGCDLQNSYGPVWGGMLNPVLSSLFFLGFILLFRLNDNLAVFSIGMPFFLFILPGALTSNFDIFRDSLALPFLLLIVALGLQWLLSIIPPRLRPLILIGLLGFSTVLDLFHLGQTYASVSSSIGSNVSPVEQEFSKTYELLNAFQSKNGPGFLLLDLTPGLEDETLSIASYPFNAFLNRKIAPRDARWIAVIVNIHYQPFLRKRFPEAVMLPFNKNLALGAGDINGGWMLVILPITAQDQGTFESWLEAAVLLHNLTAQLREQQPGQVHRETLEFLSETITRFPKDPFIQSCYWELVYSNHNWENLFGDHDVKTHFPAAIHALQEAIHEGYPTAYFYNELGSCYLILGDKNRARWAFQKAVHAPLNLTPAAENLKALDRFK